MKKEKSKNENTIYLLLIFFICIAGMIYNWSILVKDNVPFYSNLFQRSIHYSKLIKENNYKQLFQTYFLIYDWDYPPLLIFTSLPVLIFTQGDLLYLQDLSALINSMHLFILLFSVYFLGKKLSNEKVGFLSALILFLIPSTLSFSKIFMPVFSLTAYLAASITTVIYSDFFKKRRYSVLSGIFIGLGMLSKSTFAVYFSLFIISYFVFNREKIKKFDKKQIKNFFLGLSLAIIIMSIWYPFNFLHISKYFILNFYKFFMNSSSDLKIFLLSDFINLVNIIDKKIFYNTIFTILSIFSFPFMLFFLYKNKKKDKKNATILLFLLFSFLIISMTDKNIRIIYPIIPFLTLITIFSLYELIKIIFRKIKASKKLFNRGVVIFFSFFILFSLIVHINAYKNSLQKESVVFERPEFFVAPHKTTGIDKKIFNEISKNNDSNTTPETVLMFDSMVISSLRYRLDLIDYKYSTPPHCLIVFGFDIQDPSKLNKLCNIDKLTECEYDYVLDSEKKVIDNHINNLLSDYVRTDDREFIHNFNKKDFDVEKASKNSEIILKDTYKKWENCKNTSYVLQSSYIGEYVPSVNARYNLYKKTN